MPRFPLPLLAACLLLAPLAATAQVPKESDPGIEQDMRGLNFPDRIEWEEGAVDLPAYPDDDDLVQLRVDNPRTSIEVFIDLASVTVGDDGVTRYTAVVTSPRGARNIIFEGLRCSDGTYRTYAFGDGRGAFGPLQQGEWRTVRGESGAYAYRRVLGQGVLCDQYRAARSPKEVEHQLRFRTHIDDQLEY